MEPGDNEEEVEERPEYAFIHFCTTLFRFFMTIVTIVTQKTSVFVTLHLNNIEIITKVSN